MLSLLRKLFLWIFVDKRARARAEAVLASRQRRVPRGRPGAAAPDGDRDQLIKNALKLRQEKEHLWNNLPGEEREKLMEQLGEGVAARIEEIKGTSQ